MDKLGVFHANQISMWLDPHLNYGRGWRREIGLSPPVKYFTDHSKAVLFLIFYVFSVLCLLCLCACLFICALWSPAGKRLTSWLPRLWCLTVSLSLSHWYPWSCVVLDCIDS